MTGDSPGVARLSDHASYGTGRTVADVASEDVVVIGSGTQWYTAWELMMVGPFTSCALLDGEHVRHVTVAAMTRSAVRRDLGAGAVLVASDYPEIPALPASMRLADAAVLVVAGGWDIAMVMDDEPRVISACNVFRSLLVDDGVGLGEADPFDSWRCDALSRQVALTRR